MNLANKAFLLLSILCVFLVLQACSSTDENDSKRRRNRGGAQPPAQVDGQVSNDDSLAILQMEKAKAYDEKKWAADEANAACVEAMIDEKTVEACSKESQKVELTETIDAHDSILLAIEGMMCPSGCAKPIQEKLASCNGVKKCVVDFENQTAFVRFDNSSITPDSMIQIIGAVNNGAYTASVKEEF